LSFGLRAEETEHSLINLVASAFRRKNEQTSG
jgi:hypothetical protein